MVKYNGKEITKEEFKAIVKRKAQMNMEIKRLSKTELGREILKRKGIEPIE
jgi:hypothetical protein